MDGRCDGRADRRAVPVVAAAALAAARALSTRCGGCDGIAWSRRPRSSPRWSIACLVAVRNQEQLLFLVLPLLGWIAWRFQQRGAAPAALLVSVIVIAAAADDMGPFAGESLLSQMILLQTFNASVAFTTLLFASAVSERQRLVEREQGAQRELYQREHRVATTLQRSLLPERLPETIGLAVASRYIPATTRRRDRRRLVRHHRVGRRPPRSRDR